MFLLLTIWNSDGHNCLKNRYTTTTPIYGPLSGTTQVSLYQKGKMNLDFTEAKDSKWQWHQLDRVQVCTSPQTHNCANIPPTTQFFTGWSLSIPFPFGWLLNKKAARVEVNISLAFLYWVGIAVHPWPFVPDIAIYLCWEGTLNTN